MGLSSSQARLLTLTSRMHDIEYKAAKLEAQKLQMANESRRAYEDYLFALDATKIQMKTIDTDGSIKFVDATYNSLVAAGYTLKLYNDECEIVTQQDIDNYKLATENETQFSSNNREFFAALQTGRVDPATMLNAGVVEIYTASQLATVLSTARNGVDYRLMGDIDMSGVTYSSCNITSCNIDGNGHKITGLDKALFDQVKGNSNIKNLSLDGSTTVSQALLANCVITSGEVSNVHVSGSVSNASTGQVGGLIGRINQGTVQYCSSSVNAYSAYSYVGSLIGISSGSSSKVIIKDCYASGSATTGFKGAGGLIGCTANTDISRCRSTGSATSTYVQYYNTTSGTLPTDPSIYGLIDDVGGFIGIIGPGALGTSITNCSTSADVYAAAMTGGGFVGHMWQAENAVISNCSSSGTVYYNCAAETATGLAVLNDWKTNHTAPEQNGGFIGTLQGGQIVNCNSSSTIVNKWGDTTGADRCGSFAGTAFTDQGCNTFAGNYAPASGLDFFAYYDSTHTNNAGIDSSPRLSANTVNSMPASAPAYTQQVVDDAGADSARDLFDRMHKNGYKLLPTDDPRITHGDDPTWLTNMINAGFLYIYKKDKDGNEYQVSVATDTGLQEVSDEKDLRKAEAKYEADMRKIDAKDKKYDTELAAIDNERNAVKAEMETLKTVAKDNVERTFKLFS